MAAERRISIGPLIALVGAVLLLVSLFLDWYEGLTAFTVFEVLDLLLVALAVAAILALADALGARMPGPLGTRAALPLGLLAFLIVVSQLLNDPPAVVGRDVDKEVGLWLALAGSLLMLAGGLLSIARISLALDMERRAEAQGADREPAAAPVRHDAPTVAEPGTGAEPAPREAPPRDEPRV